MKHAVVYPTLLAGLIVLATGCSSTPQPRTEIALSDSALQSAELAGAREYAPIELRKAREKRDAVDAAMQAEEYDRAARYSREALVDAELAKAKAEAVKSAAALKEARDGIQLMKSEVRRVKAPK